MSWIFFSSEVWVEKNKHFNGITLVFSNTVVGISYILIILKRKIFHQNKRQLINQKQ